MVHRPGWTSFPRPTRPTPYERCLVVSRYALGRIRPKRRIRQVKRDQSVNLGSPCSGMPAHGRPAWTPRTAGRLLVAAAGTPPCAQARDVVARSGLRRASPAVPPMCHIGLMTLVSSRQPRTATATPPREDRSRDCRSGRPVTSSLQDRPVRLGEPASAEARRGDHLHPGRLGVVRVEAQAEVAVQHPAVLQDLAVDVAAKLRHGPRSRCWWMGGTRGLPGADGGVDLKRSTAACWWHAHGPPLGGDP
jgi:hypothetical protein